MTPQRATVSIARNKVVAVTRTAFIELGYQGDIRFNPTGDPTIGNLLSVSEHNHNVAFIDSNRGRIVKTASKLPGSFVQALTLEGQIYYLSYISNNGQYLFLVSNRGQQLGSHRLPAVEEACGPTTNGGVSLIDGSSYAEIMPSCVSGGAVYRFVYNIETGNLVAKFRATTAEEMTRKIP